MRLAIDLVALTILLFLVQEGFRRSGKWTAWGAFAGLPVILSPYWIEICHVGVFPWVKLYTVLFSACWFTGLLFTRLRRWRWARFATFLILPVNILEAVAQDLFAGHLAHWLLAATGILLVITLPRSALAIRIDAAGRHQDLRYEGMTRAWIAAYTLWNWSFVYLNFPAIAGQQLAVLAAALAVGVIDPRLWLQARTYTLAADLLVMFTFPGFIVREMDTSVWTASSLEHCAAGAGLAVASVYAIRFFFDGNVMSGEIGRAEQAVQSGTDQRGVFGLPCRS